MGTSVLPSISPPSWCAKTFLIQRNLSIKAELGRVLGEGTETCPIHHMNVEAQRSAPSPLNLEAQRPVPSPPEPEGTPHPTGPLWKLHTAMCHAVALAKRCHTKAHISQRPQSETFLRTPMHYAWLHPSLLQMHHLPVRKMTWVWKLAAIPQSCLDNGLNEADTQQGPITLPLP